MSQRAAAVEECHTALPPSLPPSLPACVCVCVATGRGCTKTNNSLYTTAATNGLCVPQFVQYSVPGTALHSVKNKVKSFQKFSPSDSFGLEPDSGVCL